MLSQMKQKAIWENAEITQIIMTTADLPVKVFGRNCADPLKIKVQPAYT
jgi:hypothetical protein